MSGRAGLQFASSKGFEQIQQKQLEKELQLKKINEIEQNKLLELKYELKNNINNDKKKLDWMYGGPGLTSASAEEYLLGKQFKMVGDVETVLYKYKYYFILF